MVKLLATDMDRTLLSNGVQPYDGSINILNKIIKEHNITVAFVTGRHLALVEKAMQEFETPRPDYIIGDVGTTIYKNTDGGFIREESWDTLIGDSTENWDIALFKEKIGERKGLRLQEKSKQNIFKLSYYIDDLSLADNITKEVRNEILKVSPDALVVYSVDETIGQGLLDVLPCLATKQMAIEHLRKQLGIEMEEVVYCGDSGNDILPLTKGYYGIVVRNAIDEVKEEVLKIAKEKNIESRIYVAEGYKELNGYYSSGIIEGFIKMGFVSEEGMLKR